MAFQNRFHCTNLLGNYLLLLVPKMLQYFHVKMQEPMLCIFRRIHIEQKRKRKFPLMFVVFLTFFAFAFVFTWCERSLAMPNRTRKHNHTHTHTKTKGFPFGQHFTPLTTFTTVLHLAQQTHVFYKRKCSGSTLHHRGRKMEMIHRYGTAKGK